MALIPCPDCAARVSDRAAACPTCGYPMRPAGARGAWPGVVGGVAGTYISARAVVEIILGGLMFVSFAAIMIALIVRT